MQTPRRYAPLGGSFAPVRVAGFKWNGWQASAVYAHLRDRGVNHNIVATLRLSTTRVAALQAVANFVHCYSFQ